MYVVGEDHDRVWKLLKEKTKNIEEKIKKAAEALKKQLHKDIKETHVATDTE